MRESKGICYLVKPHALLHEVSTFIYIYIYIYIDWLVIVILRIISSQTLEKKKYRDWSINYTKKVVRESHD